MSAKPKPSHYTSTARHIRRRRMAERPTAELLEGIWLRWRRDQRCGRPCFREWSPAALERLAEAQPEHELFARLLDRGAVRGYDFQSTRLRILHALFVQGRSPLDIPDEPDAADDGLAVAA